MNSTLEMLLNRARRYTPLTPSPVAYDLIAEAVVLREPVEPLLELIAEATEVNFADLKFASEQIVRHFACKRTSEASALALDALAEDYGFGLLLKVSDSRSLFHFGSTHWEPVSDHCVRSLLSRKALAAPEKYGEAASSVPTALNLIKDLAPLARDFMLAIPPPVVNTQTCEVWIGRDGQAAPRIHRPETGMRFCLTAAYDPMATSPLFDKATAENFSKAEAPEELKRHVLELMAYGIQGVRDIPVIAFFLGAGANGKSLLLEILKALVGREQVLASTVASLRSDRFMLPELAGRLLFIDDDAKDEVAVDSGLLKMIGENRILDARRVRASHSAPFCSMILPLIAMNGAPRLSDTSDGFRRRLQVIPFERRLKPEEIDTELGRNIIGAELSGVLNHLIAGLCRLRQRGGFDIPVDCQRAQEAFLAAANPLLAFLEERCADAPGQHIGLTNLFQSYCAWIKQTGQKPDLNLRALKAKLVGMGYTIRKSGVMVVDNIAFKAD